MKNKNTFRLAIVVASLMLSTACTLKQVNTAFQVFGTVCFILAMLAYIFKNKLSRLIKSFFKGKNRKTFLFFALSMLFLVPGKNLLALGGSQIDFTPAITTFSVILHSLASITAGACGFYGLTRVGWLLVNEDRSAGTSFIMAIIGYVAATIAVGLL